jgi:hypothetical protein
LENHIEFIENAPDCLPAAFVVKDFDTELFLVCDECVKPRVGRAGRADDREGKSNVFEHVNGLLFKQWCVVIHEDCTTKRKAK